jgi:hypothetical protein
VVGDLGDFELIHVVVDPSECDLEYVVEMLEGKVRWDREEAADGRIGCVAQANEEEIAVEGRRLGNITSRLKNRMKEYVIPETLEREGLRAA